MSNATPAPAAPAAPDVASKPYAAALAADITRIATGREGFVCMVLAMAGRTGRTIAGSIRGDLVACAIERHAPVNTVKTYVTLAANVFRDHEADVRRLLATAQAEANAKAAAGGQNAPAELTPAQERDAIRAGLFSPMGIYPNVEAYATARAAKSARAVSDADAAARSVKAMVTTLDGSAWAIADYETIRAALDKAENAARTRARALAEADAGRARAAEDKAEAELRAAIRAELMAEMASKSAA